MFHYASGTKALCQLISRSLIPDRFTSSLFALFPETRSPARRDKNSRTFEGVERGHGTDEREITSGRGDCVEFIRAPLGNDETDKALSTRCYIGAHNSSYRIESAFDLGRWRAFIDQSDGKKSVGARVGQND